MVSGFMRISSAITILGVMREKQNYIFPKTKLIEIFGLGPVSVTRIGVRKPGFGVRMQHSFFLDCEWPLSHSLGAPLCSNFFHLTES